VPSCLLLLLFPISILYGISWHVTPPFAIGANAGELLVRWHPEVDQGPAQPRLGLSFSRTDPKVLFKLDVESRPGFHFVWIPIPLAFQRSGPGAGVGDAAAPGTAHDADTMCAGWPRLSARSAVQRWPSRPVNHRNERVR
jgi:hypothetical protein